MKKTILFIDDDLNRRMSSYRDELLSLGYNVLSVTTPHQALEEIDKNKDKIELVILDIMMPHGEEFDKKDTDLGRRTGVLLFHKIKEVMPNVPVFILTVVRDKDVKKTLLKNGANKYEVKPILLDTFIRAVNEILKV